MGTENPVQVIDLEHELHDLLCIALDGSDTERVRYLVQLLAMRQDPNRDGDLARLRETGIGPVWTL